MKTYGIIHYHVNAFNKSMKHEGLDIVRSHNAGRKTDMQLELSDFDLLNGTFVMNHSEFRKEAIETLFSSVIFKYYEQPALVEAQAQSSSDSDEMVLPVNGKVIKSIIRKDGKETVITHDENPSDELKQQINMIIAAKSAADLQLKEQILKCANQLRVGTLDMPKNSTQLHVHTPEGVKAWEGPVTRKQLIATLWFVTKSYMFAPSFRKHLTVSVTEGKYTCGYKSGVPVFETANLTQTELDILNDIKLLP